MKILAWIRNNRLLAAVLGFLLVLAAVNGYGAWTYRAEALQAKQEIREKQEEADALRREAEIQRDAWSKRIGATDPRLEQVLREVRTVRANLAEIEGRRRELFVPPAVDNLTARFEAALEAIR